MSFEMTEASLSSCPYLQSCFSRKTARIHFQSMNVTVNYLHDTDLSCYLRTRAARVKDTSPIPLSRASGGDPQHHRAASCHHAVRRPVCRRRGPRSGERDGGGRRRRHGRLGRSGFQDGGKNGPVPLVRQRPQDPPHAVTGGRGAIPGPTGRRTAHGSRTTTV